MLFFSVAAFLHCRPMLVNAWLEKNRQYLDWKISGTFADDGHTEEAVDCSVLVKEPFKQYTNVWFSYEPKSVPNTVVDATLQRQHPATVTWQSTLGQIVQT